MISDIEVQAIIIRCLRDFDGRSAKKLRKNIQEELGDDYNESQVKLVMIKIVEGER